MDRLISPELALVDPELRQEAIALLQAYPPVPLGGRPRATEPKPVLVVLEAPRATPRPVLVAAAVYVASAALRVVVLDALLVFAIALLVLALSLLG